jgi:hypothetical protein
VLHCSLNQLRDFIPVVGALSPWSAAWASQLLPVGRSFYPISRHRSISKSAFPATLLRERVREFLENREAFELAFFFFSLKMVGIE